MHLPRGNTRASYSPTRFFVYQGDNAKKHLVKLVAKSPEKALLSATRSAKLFQLFVEELNDALNAWLVALFGKHRVIFFVLRRQLDRDERIADQLTQ